MEKLEGGARTIRATGHLDASDKGPHIVFNTILFCVLVVCGPSQVWDPRQEPLLPRCMDVPGCGSMWALASHEGHHLQRQQRGSFLRTLEGAGSGRKKWQMVL